MAGRPREEVERTCGASERSGEKALSSQALEEQERELKKKTPWTLR